VRVGEEEEDRIESRTRRRKGRGFGNELEWLFSL